MKTSRRMFLGSAAAAAVVSATRSEAQSTTTPVSFVKIPGAEIAADKSALEAAPGNKNLFVNPALPVLMVLTTEKAKAAKEFEYHEQRDHIFQILEGETSYELGGTPVNPRNTKPQEWLAPDSKGATKVELKKGDVLVVPRGTPHRRTTKGSVTFYLISAEGAK